MNAEPLRNLVAPIANAAGGDPQAVAVDMLRRIRERLAQPDSETLAFLSSAYEPLKTLPPGFASSELAEALISIAHFYAISAQPVPGLAPAADAVACARQCDNGSLLMKALRMQAWVVFDSGNFPDAVASVSKALTMAREAGDVTAECACWNSLGVYFHQTGQSSESINYFERAIELAGEHPERRIYKDSALSNIAMAALDVHDLRRAFASAQEGVADQLDPKGTVECDTRAMREIIFVRVLVELGDLERAREHLEKARQFVGVAGTDRAKLSLANTQALVEIASNMVDMGLTRIKQTLETTRLKNKGLLPSVLATSVIAYERAGQPDVALTLLHDLLDHKKEMKQAQVLMHHRMHMARVESMRGADEGRDAALRDHHHQLRMQMQDRELVRRNLQLLEEQSVAAELHDDTTGEHCYRVGRLASILGKEIGLEEDICFLIDLTARLHDIGKLVVPDAILLKPGKLTPGEREIMQKHTTAGADILARTSLPQIHIAEAIARHHHERWDGNGYPDRLSGNSIPLAARVTALADVFDALTHKRPYKEAWPIHAALAEIKDLSGKQFDPELCGIFLDLVPRLQREQGDLDYFLAADAKNATFIKARRSIAAALKGNDPSVSIFDLRR